MKNLISLWLTGIIFSITDELISFYTFITIALAECAALWVFFSASIAIPFTIILIGYVLSVLLFGWLKGDWEGERIEKFFSILYIIVFCALFITGCFFNLVISIVITAILLAITALFIAIRDQQITIYSAPLGGFPKIVLFINKLFRNKIIYILSQIIILAGPIVAFTTFFAMIPTIPLALKIIVPIVYFFFTPFFAYIEDSIASCNVFQIAYDITWSEELEEMEKRFREQCEEKNKDNHKEEN